MNKNLLLSFLLLLVSTMMLNAQTVDVTVSVDMTNETVDAEGVHIAGNWDPNNEWNPGSTKLTEGADNVWSITLTAAASDTFEYKFINGNEWGKDEGLNTNSGCVVDGGNGNRVITTSGLDINVPVHCYNSCGPCTGMDQVLVDFKLDMSKTVDVNTDSIYVTGDFAEWKDSFLMTDYNNDNVYNRAIAMPAGDYGYKFKNGPSGWEGTISGDCTDGGNRVLSVAADTIMPAFCFEDCGPCIVKNNVFVTFKVDMTNEATVNGVSPNGVHIAGSFQSEAGVDNDWQPGETQMTDMDGDMVYEITVNIPEGDYQYKFLNGNDWGTEESIPQGCVVAGSGNRGITVAGAEGSNQDADLVCFSTCDAQCPVLLDPIEVTFVVDMSNEFLSGDGLFVSGDFFLPKWNKDTLQMEANGTDGLYTFKRMIRPGAKYAYKFFNGGESGEEPGDLLAGGCGVDNGFGGSNRLLDLENVTDDIVLPAYIFGTCDISSLILNNREIDYLNEFVAFPNPTEGQLTIQFSNPANLLHSVELYNIAGQQILTTAQQIDTQIEVNANDVAPGLYIGKLINEKGASHAFKVTIK